MNNSKHQKLRCRNSICFWNIQARWWTTIKSLPYWLPFSSVHCRMSAHRSETKSLP